MQRTNLHKMPYTRTQYISDISNQLILSHLTDVVAAGGSGRPSPDT